MGPSILPLSRQIQSKASQSPGETGSFVHHGGIKAEPEGRADIEVLVNGIHLAMALDMQRQEGTHRDVSVSGREVGHTAGSKPSNTSGVCVFRESPHPFFFFYDSFLSSSLSHFFPLPVSFLSPPLSILRVEPRTSCVLGCTPAESPWEECRAVVTKDPLLWMRLQWWREPSSVFRSRVSL